MFIPILRHLIARFSSVLLLFPVLAGCEKFSPARFELYPAKSNSPAAPYAELETPAILTDRDIVSYDWATHSIALTEVGEKRIFDYKKRRVWASDRWVSSLPGKEFIVVADGQQCYRGAFWERIWSQSHGEPVIDVYRRTGTITIQRCYPQSFTFGSDPRNDPRIAKLLKELGKLRNGG